MADLATALFARLTGAAAVNALIGTKMFPMVVPQNTALNYVRYQVISDPRAEHLKGVNGRRSSRVQFDCFSASYLVARQLARKIANEMIAPATVGGVAFGHASAVGPRDGGEDVVGGIFTYRASVDLLVEHDAD